MSVDNRGRGSILGMVRDPSGGTSMQTMGKCQTKARGWDQKRQPLGRNQGES